MTWWLWLILAVLMAGGCGFFLMLSLSSASAYGANFHSLTPRQRFMGNTLYVGALMAAFMCAALGCFSVYFALSPLWS